jgi:hypothetical protein
MEEESKSTSESEEVREEKAKKPNNLIVYIPVVVFVVIIVVGGYFLLRNGSKGEVATDQASDQNLFKEGGLAERKSEILITDFSKGESIMVDYVLLERRGFVGIHGQIDGKPGEVIGVSSLLEAGETENVNVTLKREVQEGEILFAILHKDDGDGEFSFPGPDTPVTDDYKNIIMSMFRVGESEVSIEEATSSADSTQ